MDSSATVALAGAVGLFAGGALTSIVRRLRRAAPPTEVEGPGVGPDPGPTRPANESVIVNPLVDSVPEDIVRVLSVLPEASVVISGESRVLRASDEARRLGLVQGTRLASGPLTRLVAQVRRDGVMREREIDMRRPPLGRGLLSLRVRVATMTDDNVLLLAEDLSESRRLDAVRRDFVANVSHELKTPVGALSLLAEAVQSASDDAESVRHFAGRMQIEAVRLTNLVNDLIDLSRLQGEDPIKHATEVPVDRVVLEAVDSLRLVAQAKEIEFIVGGTPGLKVFGDEAQLVMALRNLISNAVTYSPPRTRVAVATKQRASIAEVSVTDQGIGIPEDDIDRVFERFYRVDPARSRVTGGTGLGLSIVKHVAANHGGEVTLWSVEGEGSTFTVRLPVMGSDNPGFDDPDHETQVDAAPEDGDLPEDPYEMYRSSDVSHVPARPPVPGAVHAVVPEGDIVR